MSSDPTTYVTLAPGVHLGFYEAESDEEVIGGCRWTVLGDLRRPGSGWGDTANYDVYDLLKPRFPTVDFDSESSCFYAYAPDRETVEALVADIREWVVSR